MLSAQKQEMPSDTPPESSPPQPGTGFGKVLSSLQGLQQRLDDFSVEEVSRAHERAQTFIRELDRLQVQLTTVAKFQASIITVNAQLAAIPAENFDLIGPASLENHPQLHTIVQAGKLIRMHRALRAARATTAADGHANEASASISTGSVRRLEETAEPLPVSQAAPPKSFVKGSSIIESEIDSGFQKLAELGAAPLHEKPVYHFADLKLEETPRYRALSPTNSAQAKPTPPSGKSKNLKGKPQIDQRLLSELIETYGEFAIATEPDTLAGSVKKSAAAIDVPPAATALAPLIATPLEPASSMPKESRELVRLTEPAQKRPQSVVEPPSPTAKSQGEIDRQLKRIIKDYGEYDLYSDRQSVNLKKALIAAIAGLALLAGGFYLMTGSSNPTPAVIETTSGGSAQEVREQPATRK